MSPSQALVLAHYHSSGRLRDDTLALLARARRSFGRVILVSTHLSPAQARRAPEGVQVIVRDNVGYDFYSYRRGLLELAADAALWRGLDQAWIMNSSFLCWDAERFLAALAALAVPGDSALGVTRSFEIVEHLQSYCVGFGGGLLRRRGFLDWWRDMRPLDRRGEVIERYELGLSRWILGQGLPLAVAYEHRGTVADRVGDLSEEAMREIIPRVDGANPSHFHWKKILDRFAIMKIEIIKSNPCSMNLSDWVAQGRGDPAFLAMVQAALEN